MAVVARQHCVFAGQAERGVARVIERRIEPSCGLMAVFTLVTAAAVVGIVTRVAAIAGRRGLEECLIRVTVKTSSLFVLAQQAKSG